MSRKAADTTGLPFDFLDPSRYATEWTARSYRGDSSFLIRSGTLYQLGWKLKQWGPRIFVPWMCGNFLKRFLLDDQDAMALSPETAAREIVRLYPQAAYPAVVLAPASGASAAIARLLNAPLLPLSYGMGVAYGKATVDPDDVVAHYEAGRRFADKFLKKYAGTEIVQVYDPLHERERVKDGMFIRPNFSCMPKPYAEFIKKCLAPGGRVIYFESRVPWRQYQAEERFSFQVGKPGGISDDEFIRGSKRLIAYHEKNHRADLRYRLNIPDAIAPESLYGSPPPMKQAAQNWSAANGFSFQSVRIASMELLTRLAANLFVRASRKEGKRPATVWVCSGAQFNLEAAFRTRCIPYWMPSAANRDLKAYTDYLADCPVKIETALLSIEPCLGATPDLLPLKKWKEASGEGVKTVFLGNSFRRHPIDFAAYFGLGPAFRFWAMRKSDPLEMWLQPEKDWDEELQALGLSGDPAPAVAPQNAG